VLGERGAEIVQVGWSVSHLGGCVQHGGAVSVHHGKDSFALVYEGSIEDQVSIS